MLGEFSDGHHTLGRLEIRGQADLRPVGYFHVVFTLPAEIAAIAYQNKAMVYDLLFKAAAARARNRIARLFWAVRAWDPSKPPSAGGVCLIALFLRVAVMRAADDTARRGAGRSMVSEPVPAGSGPAGARTRT